MNGDGNIDQPMEETEEQALLDTDNGAQMDTTSQEQEEVQKLLQTYIFCKNG